MMNDKLTTYRRPLQHIEALIEGENDPITIMATVACELYHAFDYLNWVGFYRRVATNTLKVGPYQGTHGCLSIDIRRGVCGACVRTGVPQVENDVLALPHHIACSSDTRAELVIPVFDPSGDVAAVLDIDSVTANVFDSTDIDSLKPVCARVFAA